jgi:hypothetical protein
LLLNSLDFTDANDLDSLENYRYRVGFVSKKLPLYEPRMPKYSFFNEKNFRDFILTKIYNGTIVLRQVH